MIMKILSIDKAEGGESVWIEDEGFYKDVVVDVNDVVHERFRVPVSKYKNYDHFVAVMGKFDAYAAFRKKPVTVEKLDYEELVVMRHGFEKEVREYQKKMGMKGGDEQ